MASDPSGRAAGDAARPAAGTQLVRDRRRPSPDQPRRRGTRSIRLRLLLPVLVATIGLVALGVQQSLAAVSLADQGGKAQTVAATAVAAVRLEYQLEREVAETDALHQRGGTAGASLVSAARKQTDLAVTRFLDASGAASRLSPDMRPLLDSARTQLGILPQTRVEVGKFGADQLCAPVYDPILATLIAIADALPQQISDAVLAAKARALVALSADAHLGALERDVLREVFRRGAYSGTELAQLSALVGQQQERRAEYNRNADAGQREEYQRIWAGTDGAAASRILTDALGSPARVAIDPEVWYIAQSNALRQQDGLQSELSRGLGLAAQSQQGIAQTKALVTAVSTIGLVLLALGTALMLAVRTSRRLRRLRAAALGVAQVELPEAIATLRNAHDAAAVRGAVRDATSRVDGFGVPGADEITEVGQALGQVHRQALRLAADQAALRIDVAALFVALSRRGQTLIQRQLQLIDDFERVEADPHRLSRLFAIDHLAARMRRNEENLLVLAGGEPGRKITAVVPLIDLVRAAAAEIEDYDRIDPVGISEVGIVATAARDLIHLLAELLENATFFSPPTSRVRVTARRDVDGVLLSVYDEGIGLPPAQLAEANARLTAPTQLTAELAGTMGLLVVSRLARRHAIGVRLSSAHRGGTVAVVQVPNALLAQPPSVTEHTAAMLRRSTRPGEVVEGEIMPLTQEIPLFAGRAAVGVAGAGTAAVAGSTGQPAVTRQPAVPRTPAIQQAATSVAPQPAPAPQPAATGRHAEMPPPRPASVPTSPVPTAPTGPASPGPAQTGPVSAGPVSAGPAPTSPGSAGPAPTSPGSAGLVSAGSGSAGSGSNGAGPNGPVRPGPVPPVPAGGAPATVMPAGGHLPQRHPGRLLLPGAAVDASAPDGTRRGRVLPPDPDLVRARLAGLASGLAAAARHIEPGTTQSRHSAAGGERPHATIAQQHPAPLEPVPPSPAPHPLAPPPRQDGAR